KQLEDLLAKRLNTPQTLQAVSNKIESAANEVETMKGYDTSTRTLRAILLQNSLLLQEPIEATMGRVCDVPVDHIEDAITAAVPNVEDDKLEDELGMLV
ncbi:hypothetical protein FS837_004217, partial [Tulasnella sp. UAMH 9824]